MVIAPAGQIEAHLPQPVHASRLHAGTDDSAHFATAAKQVPNTPGRRF